VVNQNLPRHSRSKNLLRSEVVEDDGLLDVRKRGLLSGLVMHRFALAASLSFSALLGLGPSEALAEGTAQIGIGQDIVEYGITYDNTTSGVFSPNHAIYVDITNPGEIINVSVCGEENSDDVRIEIYNTTPNPIDSVLVPTSGTQLLSQPLTESNIDCANPLTGPLPSTGAKTPLKFTTPSTGTYEVRLFNVTDAGILRPVLSRVDVTVTPNAAAPVDPTELQGRIYSYSWAYDAGAFTVGAAADTDYFVKVPGGRAGENFVWLLDLNNFAGFAYEMIANNLGLESPFEGLSAPFDPQNPIPPFDDNSNKINPLFPLYLSYPEIVGIRPTLPPEVTNFRFTDSAGVDNSISPGSTNGTQDTGTFSFSTDVTGTSLIIIDVDQDGIYAPGDTYIFGETVPGINSLSWDGRDNNGVVLSDGTYSAQLQVRLGEFHFVAADAETSGGGTNNGLTVFEALSSGSNIDTQVYWDDQTILGATTTLPDGQPSSSPLARHTWGNFTGGGFGNRNFIDTYVYGDSTTVTSAAVIDSTDTPIERDYGDAPDTAANGTSNTNYNTTESDAGPNHIITADLAIGTAPDADDGTQQNTAADADDASGNDEGSISLPTLQSDETTYTVSNIAVTNTTTDPAFLVGWIDFDQSGSFDPDEQATATVAAGGTTADLVWNTLPADTMAGTTYARFRFSSVDGLSPTGSAIDGEVEDYRLTIAPPTPSICISPSSAAFNTTPYAENSQIQGLEPLSFFGGSMVFESALSGSASYSGGVQVQSDGVIGDYLFLQPTNAPNYLTTNNEATYTFTFPTPATNFSMIGSGLNFEDATTIEASYLGVPIQLTAANFSNLSAGMGLADASGDGQSDTVIGSATSGGVSVNTNLYTVDIPGPIDTITVTSGKADGATGTVTIGLHTFEYCTDGAPVNGTDFGDAPDSYITTLGIDGARHSIVDGIHLGTAPDSEADAVPPLDGSGDGAEDDGIVLSTLTASDTDYTIPAANITATGPGTLHAWIDFDEDGTFNNTTEYASVTVADGTPAGDLVWNSITPPSGDTFARFRFTSDSSVTASTPSGSAVNGEVEDYVLPVATVPNMRLVKRITAINRGLANPQIFDTSYVDVTDDDSDNALNWPGGPVAENFGSGTGTVESYITGITGITALAAVVENTTVAPGDVLEYTIPFLSDGDAAAQDVYICDRIPTNTTFVGDAFDTLALPLTGGGNRGIMLSFDQDGDGTTTVAGLTNANDGDEIADTGGNDNGVGGYYFPPTVDPSAELGVTVNCGGPNDNGAIVVDLSDVPNATGDGVPLNSHGFIRFRAVVD